MVIGESAIMLKLDNLTVIYPDKTKAIDSINLTAANGENIALIGENGAGKTSLLLTIVGILEPECGLIEIDGMLLTKKTVNEIRKKIGLVFQNPDDQLFMPFIFDDIAFGCRNFGMHEEDVKIRVEDTLNQLNISHLCRRSPLKLSEGEKRIAAIAAVLAMAPSVLMFDEPSAFLDHKARRTLIDILKKLHHTKIIVTHDMYFAAEVCDRVIILKNGRIAADGDISLLYDSVLMGNSGLDAIRRG